MTCHIHENHPHVHGENCGHEAVKHGDHVDYLHDVTVTAPTRATGMSATANNLAAKPPGPVVMA